MERAGTFFGRQRVSAKAGRFDFELATAVIAPDDVPDHVHDDAHFVLAIDRGYVSAAFNERPTETPGALVYNPPGTDHRDRFTQAGGRFFGIEVPADMVPDLRGGPQPLENAAAQALASELAGGVVAGEAPLELEGRMLSLVAALRDAAGPARLPSWVRRARDTIRARAGNSGFNVAQLAGDIGVHPVHLARTYRRHFGIGPAQAIQHARLHFAIEALRAGEPLALIAADVGFADQAHLTRSMKRYWGVTPSALRTALH